MYCVRWSDYYPLSLSMCMISQSCKDILALGAMQQVQCTRHRQADDGRTAGEYLYLLITLISQMPNSIKTVGGVRLETAMLLATIYDVLWLLNVELHGVLRGRFQARQF